MCTVRQTEDVMFKLDKKQKVALGLSIVVGVILGLAVGYLLFSSAGGNAALGGWISYGEWGWHGSLTSAGLGAFVAVLLFYIRVLTTKDKS
jgi:hypothetical protein